MSLNILVINWQDILNPQGGGAEVHLHEIFKRIVGKGHQVILLSHKFSNSKIQENIDGIQVIRTSNRNTFNFSVPKAYFNLLKKHKFDIIIDDINKIPFYTPLFVKKPIIGIIHHLFGSSIFLETKLPFAIYVAITEKLIPIIYRNTPIAVVSKSTKQELIEKGFNDKNLHILYNGVDLSVYKKINISKSKTPLIGYLGRIKKYKSVDHLLIAFKYVLNEIPTAKLMIIGDGDYLSNLKQLTKHLKIDDVVSFMGAVDNRVKLECLNRIWFTVNPSPKEGWGLTVIESNACGVPVIAADSPGLRDSVLNEKTGLLYEYGNCDKLSKRMIQLIRQKQLLQELSENSLHWAKNFNWDHSADKMLNLIECTLSN